MSALRRDGRERQRALLVEQHELAVRQHRRGLGQPPLLPQDLARAHVHGDQDRRTEVAGRSVDVVADAQAVAVVDAQLVAEPQLLHLRLVARAGELQDAAAAAVGGGDEQQLVLAPDGQRDVEAPVGLVRVVPQHRAVLRVEPGDPVRVEHEELVLAVQVDDHERGRRRLQVRRLPGDLPVPLAERDHALALASHRHQHVLAVRERAARVAAALHGAAQGAPELLRPALLPARLLERHQAAGGAHREQQVAGDQRRHVRAGAVLHVHALLDRRLVDVLPARLARRGVERDHGLRLAARDLRDERSPHALGRAVHGEERFAVGDDRGVAVAQAAAPERPGSVRGPARGQARRGGRLEVARGPAPLRPGRPIGACEEAEVAHRTAGSRRRVHFMRVTPGATAPANPGPSRARPARSARGGPRSGSARPSRSRPARSGPRPCG